MSYEGGLASDIAEQMQDYERQLQEARDVACDAVARLAEIERLLRDAPNAHYMKDALAVASGAAVQIPLRVLVEATQNALRARGWTEQATFWFSPGGRHGARSFEGALAVAIEREEAAPAAEARCPKCDGEGEVQGPGSCMVDCRKCGGTGNAPAAEATT